MKKDYIPRLIDSAIEKELQLFGAVLISGPKWCGKTTTAETHSESSIKLQDKKQADRWRKIADLDPAIMLRGKTPLLIDEWQTIPAIWDAVRFTVDERGEKGQFILTGSVTLDPDEVNHSGAGRISRMKMWTLSLFESGISDGSVSISSLFEGKDRVSGMSELGLPDVANALVRGGWPETVNMDDASVSRVIRSYCMTMLESDVMEPSGVTRDKRRMESLLRSLSRNVSTAASAKTIMKDMNEYDGTSVSETTLYAYMKSLRRVSVSENVPAWTPKLRSKARVRSSDTICFSDPAIAAFFLGAGKDDLLLDPNTFGLLFENMAVRDLRVYSQAMGGDVFHYHDSDDLEVDIVVRLWDGRWGAFEVKLTDNWADKGAENLLKLKNKVDESMHPPSFLAVLTATGPAYTREDGIHVIPLTCLRD